MPWSLLWSLLIAYALVCLAVTLFQKHLIYHPGPPPQFLTRPPGYPLTLTTSDEHRLGAWFLPAENSKGALVFCHGNAGNIEGRIPNALVFAEMGWDVLLFDYRGYGDSEGSPTEQGTYRDAEAAYDWLARIKDPTPSKIVTYGESLGGAVAVELGLNRKVDAVIVEAAFRSVPDLASELFRWLPARWLTRYDYASIEKVDRLGVPVLVIHSPEDDLIPFSHGKSLFEQAKEPKEFLETERGHNSGGFLLRREYHQRVQAFLDQSIKPR